MVFFYFVGERLYRYNFYEGEFGNSFRIENVYSFDLVILYLEVKYICYMI